MSMMSESIPTIIKKQMEEVADKVCNEYCKYPNEWDEEKEGVELSESQVCCECPIRRLI